MIQNNRQEEKNRKRHILQFTPRQWQDWFEKCGEPEFRVDQVLDWIYAKMEFDPEKMSNLSKDLRARIMRELDCTAIEACGKAVSNDAKTTKVAFKLHDGKVVESVLMEHEGRYTFCISTQVGCALGCGFCATGRGGFERNLSEQEIIGQILHLARRCGTMGNVVFMGMGEPLLNMDALLPALESLVDPRRFGLGSRRITVSTAGIADKIKRLSAHPSRPNLALSLNSPFDTSRCKIMPVGHSNPLGEVLDACEKYMNNTGRSVMLEYVLLGGLNTSEKDAGGVADIAKRLGATVNLIEFNRFENCRYQSPQKKEIQRFRAVLENRGVTVIQRYKRGADIAAGCGQLRAKR